MSTTALLISFAFTFGIFVGNYFPKFLEWLFNRHEKKLFERYEEEDVGECWCDRTSDLEDSIACLKVELQTQQRDTAKRIFEDIRTLVVLKVVYDGEIIYDVTDKFTELKKKYTEEINNDIQNQIP